MALTIHLNILYFTNQATKNLEFFNISHKQSFLKPELLLPHFTNIKNLAIAYKNDNKQIIGIYFLNCANKTFLLLIIKILKFFNKKKLTNFCLLF